MKLGGLMDSGRLACALERAQLPIFMSKHGQKTRLSVQNDLFMGVPIFYYTEVEKGGEFLAYRNAGETEEVQLVESASTPSYIYSPIIHVLKLPSILEHKREFHQKFLAAQVADLASLVKLATYKMLYEEPPLPALLLQERDQLDRRFLRPAGRLRGGVAVLLHEDEGRTVDGVREVLAREHQRHGLQQEDGRARASTTSRSSSWRRNTRWWSSECGSGTG